MNIDIVNKQVSKKLNIPFKTVAAVHMHLWKNVKTHICSYDSRPININNLFVLYPSKYLVKNAILAQIQKIRKIKTSKKYSENSKLRENSIAVFKADLLKFWKIRKENKYTN